MDEEPPIHPDDIKRYDFGLIGEQFDSLRVAMGNKLEREWPQSGKFGVQGAFETQQSKGLRLLSAWLGHRWRPRTLFIHVRGVVDKPSKICVRHIIAEAL